MKKSIHLENAIDIGEPSVPAKRRGRKPKKQLEKEAMADYYAEFEKEQTLVQQRSLFENIQYLSPAERAKFDAKFTQPKNDCQIRYHNLLRNKNKKIIVATGPAGTGKTLFATEMGIKHFLLGTYEKLIFTRPSVSVDEDLGFLPGTLEEKMAPWIRPIYDVLYQFITPKEVTAMLEEKIIEIAPLGYMRGRTFKNAWIVADEMQNSTVSQMKMLMTRLGENSRVVITGDLDQFDRVDQVNGLEDFLSKFKGKRSTSISSVEFAVSDIQREEVVKEVLEIYNNNKGTVGSLMNPPLQGTYGSLANPPLQETNEKALGSPSSLETYSGDIPPGYINDDDDNDLH